jgi:glycerate 2-kinase
MAPSMSGDGEQRIVRIVRSALQAVDARQAVRAHVSLYGNTLRIGPRTYSLNDIDRIFIVGAGKAGAPMSAALEEILATRLTRGVVNVKYGHTSPLAEWRVRFGGHDDILSSEPHPGLPVESRVAIIEAGHPVPDEAGLVGAERIATLVQGLTARDLVIIVISGGGSALLPLPAHGVTLDDYRALTDALLRCGADIREINAVRKHCSRLQGGGLARLAMPAQVAALILSDVVGSPLDVIASGPTAPDRTTFADALAVLDRYGIVNRVPWTVLDHLRRGADGKILDTPKPRDPLFDGVANVIIGDNERAGRAAVLEAEHLEYHSMLLSTFVQGEAREIGKAVAGLAQGIAWGQSDLKLPACLVLGGETTVTVRGQGSGGRNQELALAAAIALDGYPLPDAVEVAIVSLATDGTDGPTGAAGGIATGDTVRRGRALGLDARAALAENDSYHYLGALGDLIITGPTGTNVNDLVFVMCWRNTRTPTAG